jgi:hypothetical protein
MLKYVKLLFNVILYQINSVNLPYNLKQNKMKLPLHNNTEYITGVIHAVFYNENESMSSLNNYCDSIDVTLDLKTDEVVIICYDKEGEGIEKRFSRIDLTLESLYSKVYYLHEDFYNEFKLA